MKKNDNYQTLTENEYIEHFGINNPEKKDLHKEAFKKAWDTRNFEIDKFWQRSAFFWGFIVLIFGGYITVVTGNNNVTARGIYLDFYLILLGIIFSVAWILVICASKRWQENWEKHIDYLEDEITGKLYKTSYYNGKTYYSVSKINLILAWVVLITWIFLFIQYFYNKCNIFEFICNNFQVFLFIVLPFLGTIACIVIMLIDGRSFGGNFKAELKEGENGAFFVRDKKE